MNFLKAIWADLMGPAYFLFNVLLILDRPLPVSVNFRQADPVLGTLCLGPVHPRFSYYLFLGRSIPIPVPFRS